MKKPNNNVAVQLAGVSKQYTIHHEKPTLVEKFVKGPYEKFWALRDINLTIKKGDKIGIIGPNGSGKTTLLKIISGISTPTKGTVYTDGKIVSLIDLQAGFHPDLTGYQNIYLSGMLLGMTKEEMNNKITSVIEFAELKQFIDAPLLTYSGGMALRLGFSIAVYANPDILILDEGLGIGDEYFQKKTRKKIQEFFLMGKTIILVSHWLEFIIKNTHRIILLEQGKVTGDGDARIVNKYQTT